MATSKKKESKSNYFKTIHNCDKALVLYNGTLNLITYFYSLLILLLCQLSMNPLRLFEWVLMKSYTAAST